MESARHASHWKSQHGWPTNSRTGSGFSSLAAVTDPAAVPDAVAAVLGITQQPGKTRERVGGCRTGGPVRLLVFDNCEHVLDAAADLVEAILDAFGDGEDLGHQPRRTGGRRRAAVAGAVAGRRSGVDSPAVTLFVERAQGWRRASRSPRATKRAVVEICRRLDGIPLAIELAASRMASMTASEVRDRLDHRFRLLVGSRRGLERHQTLRHAVAWSYDLLDDAEKMLLDGVRCSQVDSTSKALAR